MAHPQQKPFTRWTRDTETAFLLALRLTGQVSKAAAEIGRSAAGAYQRRQRNAAFARAWDEAVAAQQAEWAAAGRPPGSPEDRLRPGRDRFDGWNDRRRRAFLSLLSECGSVTEACRRAGISTTAAYRRRGQDERFAREWEAALTQVAESVERAAFRRAVEGWEEPIVSGGQVIGTRRRYSDTLLHALLRRADALVGPGKGPGGRALTPEELVRRAHEAARAAGGGFHNSATAEQTNAAIVKGLAALRRRREREEAERHAKEWERWCQCWAEMGRAKGAGPGRG